MQEIRNLVTLTLELHVSAGEWSPFGRVSAAADVTDKQNTASEQKTVLLRGHQNRISVKLQPISRELIFGLYQKVD